MHSISILRAYGCFKKKQYVYSPFSISIVLIYFILLDSRVILVAPCRFEINPFLKEVPSCLLSPENFLHVSHCILGHSVFILLHFTYPGYRISMQQTWMANIVPCMKVLCYRSYCLVLTLKVDLDWRHYSFINFNLNGLILINQVQMILYLECKKLLYYCFLRKLLCLSL